MHFRLSTMASGIEYVCDGEVAILLWHISKNCSHFPQCLCTVTHKLSSLSVASGQRPSLS
jgi:hypothetical protein